MDLIVLEVRDHNLVVLVLERVYREKGLPLPEKGARDWPNRFPDGPFLSTHDPNLDFDETEISCKAQEDQ